MKKYLSVLMLLAALVLPWASRAQDCTQTVPYTEGFESVTGTSYSTAGTLPACWNGYSNGTSAGYSPHVVTGNGSYSYQHTGLNSLVMTSGSGATYGNTKIVMLPPMNMALNQLVLSFWMCTESASSGTLYVGYVTADDTSTFTSIASYPASSATVHTGNGLQATAGEEVELSLISVPSTATRLAFKWYHNSTYYSCCLDDIALNLPPSCPRVENLSVLPEATTATLSWIEAGSATSWEVVVSNGTGVVSTDIVNTNPIVLSNLTPQTNYTVSVRAVCGYGDTSNVRSIFFSTPCAAVETDSLPWNYGFEDATGTSSTSTFNTCLGRHVIGSTTAYPYPSTNHRSGTKGLYLYKTTSIQSWLTLPLFETNLNQLQVSFYAYRGTATASGHYVVGVMTNPNDISTLDTLATGHVSANSTWELVEVPLNSYTGTGQYIAIVASQSGTTANSTYIDDITVDYIPTCPTPTALVGSNATASSVDVSWTSDASEFIVEYGLQGFTQGTGDTVIAYTNSETLNNLQMGATYGVYVTAVCGNDTSNSCYGTVTAGCGALTVDNLPYTEDFELYASGSANPINACWQEGTNSSTSYPYPYTTAASNGSIGLYFYATRASSATGTSYYSWTALPPIDESLNMSDLMVNFNTKRYSSTTAAYHSMILVGVADSIVGFSNAAAIDSLVTWIDTIDITSTAASSIHAQEVSFENYTGNGKYVVFYASSPSFVSGTAQYNYIYLDDVVLRLIPTCFWPSEVRLDSVTSESAVISWTPDSRTTNPSYWTVEYGVHGFTPGEGTTEMTNDTTVTFYSLLPDTEYDVYVRANCGGDVSDPAEFVFRTACLPVATDSLPYVEDFETYASGSANPISPCWTKHIIGTTVLYPYPYTTAAITGSIGLFFYSYNTNNAHSYAALPLFESDVNDLMISFYLKRYATTSSAYHSVMEVGVMSNPDDYSTFEPVQEIDITDEPGSSIHHFNVSLEGYTGTGRYITLHAPSLPGTGIYNYVYLDSVVVDQLPACRWPVSFTVDSVGAYDVNLTWIGSASAYELQYSTTSTFTAATTNTITTSNTEALVSGLTPTTQYWFRVRSACGNENSTWSSVVRARTTIDCGPNSVNLLDTIGTGTSSSYTYTFDSYSSYYQGYNSAIYTAEELNEMGLQVNNRINGISLHSGTTGGTIRKAKIYMAETSLDQYTGTPANDTLNRANMTLVYSGDLVVPANSWVEILFDTAFTYSGTNNLRITFARDTVATANVSFHYTTYSGIYRNCYGYRSTASTANLSATRSTMRTDVAFNICTEIPDCIRPSDLSVLGYNDTSMTITWSGESPNYEVAVGTVSGDPDSVAGYTSYFTPDDTVTITGLTPSTTYYFNVRGLCGGASGNSGWSIEGSVTTACAAQPLPYTEDFESYGTGSTQEISPCWVKGTSSTTAYPYPYSSNAIHGQRSLYFYGYQPSSASSTPIYSYAALPMMADSVKNLMLSFYVRRYSTVTDYYTTRLVVGVMSNPEDITTFEPMDTIDLKNAPALSVHGYEYSFANYTGDGRYIAIFDPVPPTYGGNNYSYSYAYVDDILVDHIPSCMRPTNVTVSNIGSTTATVQWTHSATNFEVEYGPSGFEHGMGTTVAITGDSIDLTGLQVATPYDVYVRAFCTASDSSNWSFVQTFYTECGIVTVPYSEDFESYGSGASMTINPCWVKGTNNTTAYPYPYSTNAVHGERSLYFYAYHPSTTSSTSYYSYAALPEFNAPVNNLELSFSMRRYSTATVYYTSYIIVGVMTNPNDINTFVGVDTIDLQAAPASSIHDISVSFANYADTGKYIAFYSPVPPLYGTGNYSYSYSYVDDIYVSYIPACPRAYDLTAYNATASTVELEWTDTIGSTQWMVSYAVGNDTNWTEVLSGSNPYVLTGLTANTLYRYRVAPVCSDGNVSDWSREIHYFTTSQVPATVPYNYDFENAAEWANWQTSSNSNVNWYRGNVAQGNTTNAMYISADNGATHSWNMNSVTNAVAYRDIDFGAGVHSFQVDFDAYIGGTIAHNYDGVSVVVADPATPVESVSTGITSPWGHVNDVGLGTVRHDTAWGSHTIYIDNVTGVKRVAFYHFNQATGSSDPYDNNPTAIDNISITMQLCARPSDLVVYNVGANSVNVGWSGDSTAQYEVAYRVQGASASTNGYQTVTGNMTTITGLTPATPYYWWVRRICSLTATDTLVSGWVGASTFITPCVPISVADTLFEDFEGIVPAAYNATTGTLPLCWDSWSSNGATVYPHVTDSGTYSYCVSGRHAITLTSATGNASYGPNTYVCLPNIAEPTNTLTVAFWMCTESNSLGVLTVGYLTGGGTDYDADFVPIKSIPASSASTHSGNGIQSAGHGIFDTVSFDSVPAGNFPIAFRWYKESTFYSVCLDDIAVWTSASACYEPVIDIAGTTVGETSVTLSWTGANSNYEVVSMVGPWNEPAAGDAQVAGFSYTFNGLSENQTYTLGVRSVCGVDYYSPWDTITVTTLRHPCAVPTNVTVTEPSYDGATVSWTIGEAETDWQVRVFCASPLYDDTILVSGTPTTTIHGLANDAVFSVAVRAVCDPTWMSPWSDTVTLTPTSCPQVTGVTSSNVTATTATITWTSTGAASYEIEYGNRGFTQGNGTTLTSTTNSVNLTGLEEQTAYDIYVRSVCGEGVTSAWSDKLTVTTPQSDGIDDVAGSNVTLFPNPASEMVTIRGIEGECTVTVVDLNGREVYKTNANNTLTIDVTGYAKGAYFVRITGERTTAIRKLVVK